MPTSYGFIEPHNTLSNSTIGKWVKAVLANAGIDITNFSGNSARPAATSYGAKTGLALQEVIEARDLRLEAGGWSNAQTFATYHHQPIETNFGASII